MLELVTLGLQNCYWRSKNPDGRQDQKLPLGVSLHTKQTSNSNGGGSPHKQPGRPGKTVEKCSLETGAVVATFGSLRKAAKSLGIFNKNFGHMMRHQPVEHEGYLWRLSKL